MKSNSKGQGIIGEIIADKSQVKLPLNFSNINSTKEVFQNK